VVKYCCLCRREPEHATLADVYLCLNNGVL